MTIIVLKWKINFKDYVKESDGSRDYVTYESGDPQDNGHLLRLGARPLFRRRARKNL